MASTASTLTAAGAQGTDPVASGSAASTTLAATAPQPGAPPTVGGTTPPPPAPSPTATTSPAPAGEGQDGSTITVTGRGSGRSVPDLAVLSMGVEVRAATVGEAQQLAAERADAMIDAARQAGVEPADVQTTGIQIMPQYRYPDGAAPVADGYVVRNTVEVTVRDVGRTGAIIDGAVAAGGDAAVVSGIRFELADPGAALGVAREAAWSDARERAEHLASLAGGDIGRVLSIDEQTTAGGSPVPVERAGDAVTPVEPGTLSASVALIVRFELLDGLAGPQSATPSAEPADTRT